MSHKGILPRTSAITAVATKGFSGSGSSLLPCTHAPLTERPSHSVVPQDSQCTTRFTVYHRIPENATQIPLSSQLVKKGKSENQTPRAPSSYRQDSPLPVRRSPISPRLTFSASHAHSSPLPSRFFFREPILFFTTGAGPGSTIHSPPTASIFCFADALNR